MGVLSRKPDRVRRQAMPVAMSISWKPLRDSHYIVASLQPGGGGLRQIFARQSTLRDIQGLARAQPEQPLVGLLLGRRLDCALTLAPYVLIESHVGVALPWLDERAIIDAIGKLHAKVGRRSALEVLGWYCSRSVDAIVSRTHATVHAASFAEPWQTVLILGEGGAGAFFLYDSRETRWFHAPFHEVTDAKAASRAPKPTCIAWPAYLTAESIVPLAEPLPPPRPQPPLARPHSAPPPPARPQRAPSTPQVVVTGPISSPPRPQAPLSRPVVRTRRTPARDAIGGVGRAAVAARRSAHDIAKALSSRVATASRHAAESIGKMRAAFAAHAARRKAEAEVARAKAEERRAKEAAERQAAKEEAERRAAEAAKRRAAEAEARRVADAEARRKAKEAEEQRKAAEAEARRQAAEAEAQRKAAEAEARRKAEEAEAERKAAEAEARRKAAEAEAQRKAAEAEARRIAAEEAERRRAAEAEAKRQAAEVEARRRAEAEARRRAEEAEARRAAEEEAQRKAAEEAQRRAAEAEARRKAAEEARRIAEEEEGRRAAEAEARRQAEEAEARRRAEAAEAQRKAAEAEEDARRKAAEAELIRISVEVAAFRERLAGAPAEEPKHEAPQVVVAPAPDVEDTTASDGPYRYLALARREGFELSQKIERDSPELSETVWLMHEKESGLRLIIVTTDDGVREASLHYNLRTEDDSLLESTAPEHRDVESRTIYGSEDCLDGLRARCRRLRATGALVRDWKVSPTVQQTSTAASVLASQCRSRRCGNRRDPC